ncbi:DUF4232 domain-containing protein [Streptomyces sp. NPDC006326]|uniref:DUF4232 domain-containing protein n=1 Tax=Streptomyces sp. NPDC006326 TaxID=3156752 RepID=UPI0033A49643
MNCTPRSALTRISSVVLVAGLVAGAVLTGAGSGAAAAGSPSLRAAPAARCTGDQAVATGAHRTVTSQVVITVVNKGRKPCVLTGFPTVALAGLGSPAKNRPLLVVRQGKAAPVQLAVGGRASTRLSFTPVLGEADGYCASGATPTVAPTLVVGVAGTQNQLAPDDGGEFALCGTSVRATAFRAGGS